MAEGNFGLDYSSSSGYHANTKQTFFTIGMDGLSEDELKKFFQMVDRTLLRLSLPYLPSSSSLPSSVLFLFIFYLFFIYFFILFILFIYFYFVFIFYLLIILFIYLFYFLIIIYYLLFIY